MEAKMQILAQCCTWDEFDDEWFERFCLHAGQPVPKSETELRMNEVLWKALNRYMLGLLMASQGEKVIAEIRFREEEHEEE